MNKVITIKILCTIADFNFNFKVHGLPRLLWVLVRRTAAPPLSWGLITVVDKRPQGTGQWFCTYAILCDCSQYEFAHESWEHATGGNVVFGHLSGRAI